MNKSTRRCFIRRKLAEDLPGVHWYVFACEFCHREYGTEFRVAHGLGDVFSDPIPSVFPEVCSSPKHALHHARATSKSKIVLDFKQRGSEILVG